MVIHVISICRSCLSYSYVQHKLPSAPKHDQQDLCRCCDKRIQLTNSQAGSQRIPNHHRTDIFARLSQLSARTFIDSSKTISVKTNYHRSCSVIVFDQYPAFVLLSARRQIGNICIQNLDKVGRQRIHSRDDLSLLYSRLCCGVLLVTEHRP